MISATKPWQRRLTTVMMVTGLLVVMLAGLAGCARRDVSTLADRQPSLDLAEFFAGQSVAYAGLLLPAEAVRAAEAAWHDGHAPLNAVEGFIRQILGWREFVRGIYWMKMPDYAGMNFLEADRTLPDFYWTGETGMNCLAQSIDATRRYAYAHHIQRLMVLGNFALLAGVRPDQVNEWFLVV